MNQDMTPDTTPSPTLADELADLLWVLAAIANQTGVDLTEAFAANLAKKNSRDKDRFTVTTPSERS